MCIEKELIPSEKIIRSIHHLPASGGTIISKALSSLEKIVLLSEIHPSEAKNRGTLINQLWRQYVPELLTTYDAEIDEIFLAKVKLCIKAIGDEKHLIIRDHVHTDMLVSGKYSSSLNRVLSKNFPHLYVVTIRDPIETWLSHINNGWTKKAPDDFCKDYLAFCNQFESDRIFRYEDFVDDPSTFMEKLCEVLKLNFTTGFEKKIDMQNHVTGNSGRSNNIIKKRHPKKITDLQLKLFQESKHYTNICNIFGYEEPSRSQTRWPISHIKNLLNA